MNLEQFWIGVDVTLILCNIMVTQQSRNTCYRHNFCRNNCFQNVNTLDRIFAKKVSELILIYRNLLLFDGGKRSYSCESRVVLAV